MFTTGKYHVIIISEWRWIMQENTKVYAAIDLKSFYASVECKERGLDPITTNLVAADRERTEKTICLAVSPALKAYGIKGRARLFEVDEKVREINSYIEEQQEELENAKQMFQSLLHHAFTGELTRRAYGEN